MIIRYMETDKGHIHYMIETEPTMSISKIVNLMKSYTTYHIWKRYPQYLRKHLQIKNMVKNHRLAKLISDVSWYELTRQLEYKAKWNGRKYVKIDRSYASSQLCSVCTSEIRYSTKITAGEHHVEKTRKRKENIAGKLLKPQRNFVIIKKLNNKQFIHTNLASCIPKLQEAAL